VLVALSPGQKNAAVKAQIAKCDKSVWGFLKNGWEDYRYAPWEALLDKKKQAFVCKASEKALPLKAPAKDVKGKTGTSKSDVMVKHSEEEEEEEEDESEEDRRKVMKDRPIVCHCQISR